tara:strand:+ start:2491 stop:2682 length:192 start_codon:yes stop_codon:yes gene_type:complete
LAAFCSFCEAFSFCHSSPEAVVDLVVYGVGEAFGLYWADGAKFFAYWGFAFVWEEPVDWCVVA